MDSSILVKPEISILNLGTSVQGQKLEAVSIRHPQSASVPWILFLGGVHGDEIEGVWLLEEMKSRWSASFEFKNVGVVIWSKVNPDGIHSGQRWNMNNIDLNRNLPTKDWTSEIKNPKYPPGLSACSEPENKALVSLIEKLRPIAILSAHSFSKFQVNSNGPSRDWAEQLSKLCHYPVTEDIGYPTPGCLGTYAGKEKQIPTITLEIERGLSRENVLLKHVPVANASVQFWDSRLKK